MTTETFQSIWDSTVREHTDNSFLVFRSESGSVSDWTYGEFDTVVARTAGALREAGVGPGSPVHVALRNCPAFIALWLAAARLGAWLVPVDPASAARDVASQIRRVRPVLGVCAADRAAAYKEGAAETATVVIELAEDASDISAEGPLAAGAPVEKPNPVKPFDRAAVMFTSGTTSEPKGVVLTQANYAHVAETMAKVTRLQSQHRWHVTLPLFHANAQYYCFAPAIAVGASVALSAAFSASGWVSHARELGVTHASLFAAPIRMILARCAPDEQPLNLEHIWFAQSLGAEHYEQFAQLAGTRPRQLYGMTETVAIVCADTSDPFGHDVIGTPLPGRRALVCAPGGSGIAAPDEPGELRVLGTPGVDLFSGYLDDEQTTAEAFRHTEEGTWFATGDLVSANIDGVLRFVGRVDDVIKVSGENVSLTEVEAAVAQAPGVLEVAVVAQPDPMRDVVPVAYVVARDPHNPPHADDLTEWASHNLSPAARPRQWNLIDELPRTSVGKIRRFRLPADQ
ncbi:class I adenylate-forming enzyme family protein [Rhodococcus wratislaviensis]|uniref:Putative fatty-acid--CoA ligase n=1 Tax=Rhodococcus wratislaviensis NBRC 100605 TaxID=1219028 RepID=X0PZ71_RHOWR|nr:AMP-binding protein [Rhodococcus wratislaviensis]GAF43777.1 putative fatty-acid--CoA ligase [Rhodococcus wratislaviensis NBRC 100605]